MVPRKFVCGNALSMMMDFLGQEGESNPRTLATNTTSFRPKKGMVTGTINGKINAVIVTSEPT